MMLKQRNSRARIVASCLLLFTSLSLSLCAEPVSAAKRTILGCALSPANLPHNSQKDNEEFFQLASRIGGHVLWIVDWGSSPKIEDIRNIQTMCRVNGLRFQIQLSPISMNDRRSKPSIPPDVKGKSFSDPQVRESFKRTALSIAALAPDQLGLATEINFLTVNQTEYASLVSLLNETYKEIKSKYPKQEITVSFQWDVMRSSKQFALLKSFASCLDVYSFSSYPDAIKDPALMPPTYYEDIRRYLPRERVSISEIGWSTAKSPESVQAKFYQSLPSLMKNLRPESVTLALMHDVQLFNSDLSSLNNVGVRHTNGSPKQSWDIVNSLQF